MRKYNQGIYRIKNPQKYKGNPHNCTFRSSWEAKMMMWLDNNPDIIQWASEEPWFCIPYRHPLKPTMNSSRYFPDFYVKKRNADGSIEEALIEVKPAKETAPPVVANKRKPSKRTLYAQATYAVNAAKWEAADKYCKARGWSFIILTENDIHDL